MTPALNINIIDFIGDPHILGPFYEGESWARWRACLRAAYALPMGKSDLELFAEVAGDRAPPNKPVSEFVALVGRGSGKDAVAAAIAAHIASTSDFTRLRPGERGCVLLIAVDREQSGVAFGYVRALFEQVPMLTALVEKITDDTVLLTNGAAVIVGTNSYRSVRGKTIICTIYDEICFWRSENSATPDFEVDAAIGPGLARWPGALKILISSVYRRSGLAYQKWRDFFGKDDAETLVVLGTTLQFNPAFDAKIIDRELKRDFERASAEYNSIWRDDLSQFIDRDAILACVEEGCRERAWVSGVPYFAFCDPSGGRADAMTLAIAHREKDGRGVLDCVREVKPPFDPAGVVAEFAGTLKSYRLSKVTGDNYGGEWPVSQFRQHGIAYVPSERNRSQLYIDVLPTINARRVLLLDNERLISQFAALERRVARSGKDSVNHPDGGHDDISNAVAGAVVEAATKNGGPIFTAAHVAALQQHSLGLGGSQRPPPIRFH